MKVLAGLSGYLSTNYNENQLKSEIIWKYSLKTNKICFILQNFYIFEVFL